MKAIFSAAAAPIITAFFAAPAWAQYQAPPVGYPHPPPIIYGMPPTANNHAQPPPRVYVQPPTIQHHRHFHRYPCNGAAIAGPPGGTVPVYGQYVPCYYNYVAPYPYWTYPSIEDSTIYTVLWGTIWEIDGDFITLQLDGRPMYVSSQNMTVRMNVLEALNHNQAGPLERGRHVQVYGYWQNGAFFAIRLI